MRRSRTADQSLVREINLSIILHALRDHAPLSRASLATATGLNKTTVSSLVQQLIDLRIISELGTHQTLEVGRPGMLLELNRLAGGMIGVEIGVDFIAVAATDFSGTIIWRGRQHVGREHEQHTVIPKAHALVTTAIDHCRAHALPVLGLSIGVPGLVDTDSGVLLFAPNLGWRNVPLREIFQAGCDFPVYVDNEANLAALGETCFGVPRGARNLLYVFTSIGIGGGLILDGHLSLGSTGLGGEFGHMTLEPDGYLCNCGNRGCWETLASQEALFRRVRDAVRCDRPSALELSLDSLTVSAVVDAARAGDAVALQSLEDTGRYLGIGIANLVNALNPEIIVLGGALSDASEFLLPVIEDTLAERALRWSMLELQLLTASHGPDASLIGGAAKIYEAILNNPLTTMRRTDNDDSQAKSAGSRGRAIHASLPASSGDDQEREARQ